MAYKRGPFGKTRTISFRTKRRIDVSSGRFSPPKRKR